MPESYLLPLSTHQDDAHSAGRVIAQPDVPRFWETMLLKGDPRARDSWNAGIEAAADQSNWHHSAVDDSDKEK